MKYSEESQRTQAILEEFKEKRGASLMDRHVAKKAEQPKAVSTGRRAFDRELVCTATCCMCTCISRCSVVLFVIEFRQI